jgi:hypothetical protein
LTGHVGFSNRPFEVKHFQTIRHRNVHVAHGLALLFGIGTRVWGFFCQEVRQCNACLPSSVSLFDLKARFFVPTRSRGQYDGGTINAWDGQLKACGAVLQPDRYYGSEGERLIEQLSHAMREAEQLDRWLHEFHQRRIDEERPKVGASVCGLFRFENVANAKVRGCGSNSVRSRRPAPQRGP